MSPSLALRKSLVSAEGPLGLAWGGEPGVWGARARGGEKSECVLRDERVHQQGCGVW